ncbi:MAG TPA: hypothetical protein VH309_09965 [Elusimicrobiota bacterium]|nr:hypothetical protein [Elusimicrobiota bacterium]
MFIPLVLLLAQTARAQPEASWNSDQTQHFTIRHENPASSLGDDNLIERIYEALHPVLFPLVPWMTREKVQVYLYGGRDSFLKGRFDPPAWSGGLMIDSGGDKLLAVYEPLDAAVTAHELTHLYFHAFFDETGARPPAWLDEGLAMMLQDDALSMPDPRDRGPVLLSPIPMKSFLRERPAGDAPASHVGAWYRQADSVVRFLKSAHVGSLFPDFCGKIRDGDDAETSLRDVYGYADLDAFEAAWLKWRPTKEKGLPLGLGDQ